MASAPAQLRDPFVSGIREHTFTSPYDNTTQTFLEKDFRPTEDRLAPLVVIYLHGAASHQDQGMTAGIYHGAFERWRDTLASRQAIYICPEYRGGSWMGPAAELDLKQIIHCLRERYHIRNLVLAGGSMGGTSALIFASRFPKLVDGVVALCPATDPAAMFASFSEQFRASYGGSPIETPETYQERRSRDRAEILASLPLAIVHGSGDKVIPVSHSRILVEDLRKKGGYVYYVEIPEGDHDSVLQIPLSELLDSLSQTSRDRNSH